jgi:hypothetical protein
MFNVIAVEDVRKEMIMIVKAEFSKFAADALKKALDAQQKSLLDDVKKAFSLAVKTIPRPAAPVATIQVAEARVLPASARLKMRRGAAKKPDGADEAKSTTRPADEADQSPTNRASMSPQSGNQVSFGMPTNSRVASTGRITKKPEYISPFLSRAEEDESSTKPARLSNSGASGPSREPTIMQREVDEGTVDLSLPPRAQEESAPAPKPHPSEAESVKTHVTVIVPARDSGTSKSDSEPLSGRQVSRPQDEDRPYIPLLYHDEDVARQTCGPASWVPPELTDFVKGPYFEHYMGFAVAVNTLYLGWDTNYHAKYLTPPPFDEAFEGFFCLMFSAELLLRLVAHGPYELYMTDGWRWSVFDTALVCIMLADQAQVIFSSLGFLRHFSAVRSLRSLRALRIVRGVRMFKLFGTLLKITQAIQNSMSPALSAFAFFVTFTYISSVLLMQLSMAAIQGSEDHLHDGFTMEMQSRFGTLSRTSMTLYEAVVGALDGDTIVQMLSSEVSGCMGFVFIVYISVALFLLANLIVVVFTSLKSDMDHEIAADICKIFYEDGGDTEIRWEDFAEKLSQPALLAYLRSMDVYPSAENVHSLFDLVDVDSNGSLSSNEIIEGLLNLRGPGRALELGMVLRDTTRILTMLGGNAQQDPLPLEEEPNQNSPPPEPASPNR